MAWCLWYLVVTPTYRKARFADAVLLNGPGTCVPIALCCFLLKVSGRM